MNFLNETVRISIKISLRFAPNDPINNIPALVQLMAWHRPGNKPLSEPQWNFLFQLRGLDLLAQCQENHGQQELKQQTISQIERLRDKYQLTDSDLEDEEEGEENEEEEEEIDLDDLVLSGEILTLSHWALGNVAVFSNMSYSNDCR